MELVVEPGCVPRFPFSQFRVCEKKYEQLEEEKVCSKDWDALCEFSASLEDKSASIVGHIDAATAKKCLDWDFGQLFVAACDGDFFFCYEGGTVVRV